MTFVYRVTVRGRFSGLTDRQRSSLRANAAEHDIFVSGFTEEGSLTYDAAIAFFSFRQEVRLPGDETEDDACAFAVASAEQFLGVLGYQHGPLTARAMDMSAMARRARQGDG